MTFKSNSCFCSAVICGASGSTTRPLMMVTLSCCAWWLSWSGARLAEHRKQRRAIIRSTIKVKNEKAPKFKTKKATKSRKTTKNTRLILSALLRFRTGMLQWKRSRGTSSDYGQLCSLLVWWLWEGKWNFPHYSCLYHTVVCTFVSTFVSTRQTDRPFCPRTKKKHVPTRNVQRVGQRDLRKAISLHHGPRGGENWKQLENDTFRQLELRQVMAEMNLRKRTISETS